MKTIQSLDSPGETPWLERAPCRRRGAPSRIRAWSAGWGWRCGEDTGVALLETREGMCYLAPLGARDVGCRKVDRSKEGEEQAFRNRVSISSGKGWPQWIIPPELIGAAFSIAMSARSPGRTLTHASTI